VSDPVSPVMLHGDNAPLSNDGFRLAVSVLVGTQTDEVGVVDVEMRSVDEVEGVGVGMGVGVDNDDEGDDKDSDVEEEVELRALEDDTDCADEADIACVGKDVSEEDCAMLSVTEGRAVVGGNVFKSKDDAVVKSGETVVEGAAELVDTEIASEVEGTACDDSDDVGVALSTDDGLDEGLGIATGDDEDNTDSELRLEVPIEDDGDTDLQLPKPGWHSVPQ
jgi:hypothetical protein